MKNQPKQTGLVPGSTQSTTIKHVLFDDLDAYVKVLINGACQATVMYTDDELESFARKLSMSSAYGTFNIKN